MDEPDITRTFARFKEQLPSEGDLTLMILKGHLLIEEQINCLIDTRVPKHDALKDADLTAHQKICLAEAMVEETSPGGEDAWLWPAIKKLNKLRNDVAHHLSKPGIQDRIADFIKRVPAGCPGSVNMCIGFEVALWVTCSEVCLRINAPDPTEFENAH